MTYLPARIVLSAFPPSICLSDTNAHQRNKLTPQTLAGTGGTISGIGNFLKSVKQDVRIVIADPEGSGLYNKVGLEACSDLWGIYSRHCFINLPLVLLTFGVFPSTTGKS